MEITFLGTGTITPVKRHPASLVVKVNNRMLMFDSGPGTLLQMILAGINFNDIDFIFYTHFHIDHIGDMLSFIFATKYHLAPRTKPLKIMAPVGIKTLYEKLVEAFGDQLRVRYNLYFKEMRRSRYFTNEFRVWSEPVHHTHESIAYKVEEVSTGKILVYSGDTGYCSGIVRLAKDADILILECSECTETGMPRFDGHLTPQLVAKIANETNPKKLILTHFYPECENYDIIGTVKKEYDGEVIIAEDLMKIKV